LVMHARFFAWYPKAVERVAVWSALPVVLGALAFTSIPVELSRAGDTIPSRQLNETLKVAARLGRADARLQAATSFSACTSSPIAPNVCPRCWNTWAHTNPLSRLSQARCNRSPARHGTAPQCLRPPPLH
jgi:hypothetical protein